MKTNPDPRKVLIVQNLIPHYRIAFYAALKNLCEKNNIQLQLLYSPTSPKNGVNDYRSGVLNSQEKIPWAQIAPITWYGKVGWQPVWTQTKNTDLVILQQEAKYLSHQILLLLRKISKKKTALWGHGKNFQSSKPTLTEHAKTQLAKLPDWWFAYTNLTKDHLLKIGYPENQITTVQNSLDTNLLQQIKTKTKKESLQNLREQLQLPTEPIGLFLGGLHQFKRIPFLIEAAKKIHEKLPNFHLLILGQGPEHIHIPNLPWIKRLGAKTDEEKVPYCLLAQILLMPGTIGLAALDSLCLEVPIVTTNYPYHSPEICYLENNKTCIMTNAYKDTEAFAQSAISLLQNPQKLNLLQQNSRKEAKKYSAENMAENFFAGIESCLNKPKSGHPQK